MRESERLEAQEYVYELRQLATMLNDVTSRAKALDQTHKPFALTRTEIGLNLSYLVRLLEQATEEAQETLWAAELALAIEGMSLDYW